MTRNTGIVICLLVLLAVVLGAVFYVARQVAAAQKIQASADVLSAELERKKGGDDTLLTLRYNATGRMVDARARVSGDQRAAYPAGRSVTICYNPEDPSSIRVAEGSCG